MEGHLDRFEDACYFLGEDIRLCRPGDVVRLCRGIHAGELAVFCLRDSRLCLAGADFYLSELDGLEVELSEGGFFEFCWDSGALRACRPPPWR